MEEKSIQGVMLFLDKKLKATVKIHFSQPINDDSEQWYGSGSFIGENSSKNTAVDLHTI